ncbi:MAG: glycosyltransferase [Flavobacterium sp.]|nr:glycosyltransferase [Flavobacterium sp.]
MVKQVKKIAIISNSLGTGGAERFSGLLSIMLTDLGFEVHVIIIENQVLYPFTGQLLNLGKAPKYYFSIGNKIAKGYRLNTYLYKYKIDTIIDNRTRNLLIRDLITHFIFKKQNKIQVVHTAILSMYFSKFKFINTFLYQKSLKIVCVAKAIETAICNEFNFTNTITIYNSYLPESTACESNIEVPKNYFLYFGRLENNQKNLQFLIEAFAKSKVFENNYKLVLVGNGSSEVALQQQINFLQLEHHIKIVPFTLNIKPYIENAKAVVLTSHYEGFPLSIIESLAAGTPVISVDCNSGPREIIIDKYNGLLIEKNNCAAFADALRTFVNNQTLYLNCKNNAKQSIEHLNYLTIKNQWAAILK